MRTIFKYNKFIDTDMNTIVELGQSLGRNFSKTKKASEDYMKANAKFSELLMEKCVKSAGYEYTGIETIKNPMVHKNAQFINTFSQIFAQVIVPIVPETVVNGYDALYDVKQVGWGEVAQYKVESNALYIVNELAEGVAQGGQHTAYSQDYTVRASRKTCTAEVDWYQVAAGIVDWGYICAKIADSFVAYINAMVIKTMAKVTANASSYGLAGYMANGFSDDNWLALKKKVSLANGSSDVYALGTAIALGKVLPSASAFRFGSNDDIVTKGFLPSYKNVPLIELGNAMIPGTLNGANPASMLSDDFVYFVPVGFNKPCKVAIEGDTISITPDPLHQADHGYSMTIDMRIGADVIVGSKFGAINSIV